MNSKEQLRKISKHNDERAFEKLFHHYSGLLFTVSYNIVRDRELAEEIIEDVFFKLWQIRDRYADIKNLDNYLFVSVKNLSYDHLRKRGKRQFIEICDEDIKHYGIAADDLYEFEELKDLVELGVAKLPSRCRQVFDLVRMNQMSYKEAALALDITPKTVENQLRIATKKILEDLKEYYTVDSDQIAS